MESIKVCLREQQKVCVKFTICVEDEAEKSCLLGGMNEYLLGCRYPNRRYYTSVDEVF